MPIFFTFEPIFTAFQYAGWLAKFFICTNNGYQNLHQNNIMLLRNLQLSKFPVCILVDLRSAF